MPVTWNPTYLAQQPGREPLGYTRNGEAIQISPAWYRWFTEGVAPRLGGTTSPGLGDIVAVLTDTVNDVDALTVDVTAVVADVVALEAADVALDARLDTVEAELEELNMKPAVRMDADSPTAPTVIYRGEAVAGSAEASAVWRLKKIEFLAGDETRITWADGNTNFDNVWTNRAALTYT